MEFEASAGRWDQKIQLLLPTSTILSLQHHPNTFLRVISQKSAKINHVIKVNMRKQSYSQRKMKGEKIEQPKLPVLLG